MNFPASMNNPDNKNNHLKQLQIVDEFGAADENSSKEMNMDRIGIF